MSTSSIESIGQLINQFGVAESGDGLAVLRFLGMEVNAAMVGALGGDTQDLLRAQAELDARLQMQLKERLSPEGQYRFDSGLDQPGGSAFWARDVWEALEADLATLGYELKNPRFQSLVSNEVLYSPEIDRPDELVQDLVREEHLNRSPEDGWTASVNAEGQRVWTKTFPFEDGQITLRTTELQKLVEASQSRVTDLIEQIDADTLELVDDLSRIVNTVQITLREWAMDFLADERMFLQARKTDDQRVNAQLEAAAREFRQMMDKLGVLAPQWTSLSQQLANEAASRQPVKVTAVVPGASGPQADTLDDPVHAPGSNDLEHLINRLLKR